MDIARLQRKFLSISQGIFEVFPRNDNSHLDFGYLPGNKEPELTSKEMVRHVHHVFIWSPWFRYAKLGGSILSLFLYDVCINFLALIF